VVAAGAPPERVRVIHRGTDLARFPVAERSGRDGVPLRLLMVGRLVEKKGHRDALAALRRLLDAGHPARLAILGAGPSRPAILAESARLGLAGALGAAPTRRPEGLP